MNPGVSPSYPLSMSRHLNDWSYDDIRLPIGRQVCILLGAKCTCEHYFIAMMHVVITCKALINKALLPLAAYKRHAYGLRFQRCASYIVYTRVNSIIGHDVSSIVIPGFSLIHCLRNSIYYSFHAVRCIASSKALKQSGLLMIAFSESP